MTDTRAVAIMTEIRRAILELRKSNRPPTLIRMHPDDLTLLLSGCFFEGVEVEADDEVFIGQPKVEYD